MGTGLGLGLGLGLGEGRLGGGLVANGVWESAAWGNLRRLGDGSWEGGGLGELRSPKPPPSLLPRSSLGERRWEQSSQPS